MGNALAHDPGADLVEADLLLDPDARAVSSASVQFLFAAQIVIDAPRKLSTDVDLPAPGGAERPG